MSDFDVPPFEMDDNSPFGFGIDAAFNGDHTAGSDVLHEYFGGLRQTFETSMDVPVGASLAEFIDVVDLTTTTDAVTAPGKKRKMITGIGTFIATTTGKIVLGTTVAAASVGGAHAAALVNVPGLPDAAVEVVELDESTESGETLDEVIQVTPLDTEDEGDELVEESGDESDNAEGNELAGLDNEELDKEKDDADANSAEEPKNHGEVVSGFAHSTELEGCARGQAIAAMARSNGEAKRQANADDGESSDVDSDIEVDSDSKCKDDVESDEVAESAEEDDRSRNSKGQGKGKGLSKKN